MFVKLKCTNGEYIVNTDNISAFHPASGVLFTNSPLGTGDGILRLTPDGQEKLMNYFKQKGLEVEDEG